MKFFKEYFRNRRFRKSVNNASFWTAWNNDLSGEIKEGDFILVEKLDETTDYIALSMGLPSFVGKDIKNLWRVVSSFKHGGLCLENGGTRILTGCNDWVDNVMFCPSGFVRDPCHYAFYYHKEDLK